MRQSPTTSGRGFSRDKGKVQAVAADARSDAKAGDGGASEMTVENRLSENVRRLRFMQKSRGGKKQQQQTGLRAFQQQQLWMLQQEQEQQEALQQQMSAKHSQGQPQSKLSQKQRHVPREHPARLQQPGSTTVPATLMDTARFSGSRQCQPEQLQRFQHDRQQQELLRQQQLQLAHWCAPGWEIAESLYVLQQGREEQVFSQLCGQRSAQDRKAYGKYVLYRRSFGGFNLAVEAQVRRIEKKLHAVERNREELEQAQHWQQARAKRQHIFFK